MRYLLHIFRFAISALCFLSVAEFVACSRESADVDVTTNRRIGFSVSASGGVSLETGRSGDVPVACSCLTLDGGDKPMYLHVTTREGISASSASSSSVSRAEPVDETTIADAGILAFNFRGNWTENLAPNFMHNVRISKASGWTTDYYYPNKSNVRFYAYSPYACKGMVLPGKDEAGVPVIRYAVPSAAVEQSDLLVAQSDDIVCSAENKKVDLGFRHALTAIRFVTGDDIAAGKIKSVTIKGVYTKGSCTIGTVPVWSDLDSTGSFTVVIDKDFDGLAGKEITTTEQTLMMIPQTLPANASIEVVMEADGKEQTLSCVIAANTWKPGFTTTYKVSSSSITGESFLTVTPPVAFDYKGGTNSYNIASYKLRNDGTTVPAKWSVTGYSTDGGVTWSNNSPGWLILTTSGDGGEVATDYNATVTPQTTKCHNDLLSNATPVAGTYDLSTNGGTSPMNTANCYVINAPGRYSLPLVYGNAVKNGAANPDAYITKTPSGLSYILYEFINHLGNKITDPYIYNNKDCQAASAGLVWQDASQLVTNIALANGGHNIEFEVSQAHITQGNAVIAVYDSNNKIIWSWHIWVTDYHLGDDLKLVTNKQGKQFNLMPINLGWCYTSKEADSYPARSVQVRIAQNGGKTERIMTVRQNSYTTESGLMGNQPYYQCGRKDPMLPNNGLENQQNKVWYDSNGLASNAVKIDYEPRTTNEGIVFCIQNPFVYYGSYLIGGTECSLNNDYANLWNINPMANPNDEPTSGEIHKTIYDPSPVGYSLPARAAFNGFSQSNVSGRSQYGFSFTINAQTKETIFFPIIGERRRGGYYLGSKDARDSTGALVGVSSYSLYYTGTLDNYGSRVNYRTATYFMSNLVSGSIRTYEGGDKASGGAIRCMQERD